MKFRHLKTGYIYEVIQQNIINTTNEMDGQMLVLYQKAGQLGVYAREFNEFHRKFERVLENE